MKRLACALVLAGSASALMGASQGAYASPTRASDKLTLNIITPDPANISDRMSLDVSYRGEAVETVELYLDNALVAQRRILASQTRGIISFGLDTVLLTAGTHDVTVRAFGVDGKASSTTAKLKIPSADLTAPVRIAYPQNGVQVNGVVPIRVTLEEGLRSQRPYVTFFVDKELKVLRNFPPYEYNWDTTRTNNGWHLLEAWTSTEDSLTPSKSRPVHVNVNNATGETKKLNAVVDLRNDPAVGEPARKPATKPLPNPATTLGPLTPGVIGKDLNIGSVHPPAELNAGTRTAVPSGNGVGSASARFSAPASRGNSAVMPIALGPKMQGGAVVEPKEHMLDGAKPAGQRPTISDPGAIVRVVPSSRGGAPATTTVRPGESLRAVSNRFGVSSSEIARLNNIKDGAKLPKGSSLIVPSTGSFDIAFNGTPIYFDVAPRIQDGMKLAPFRQIFEHTGGRLYWYGGTAQTVRAVNDTREIEIKIGSENALVNNKTLKMDHKPFIDSGRTIVPLTFIRDSMDVKINWDEKTGHLLIESIK